MNTNRLKRLAMSASAAVMLLCTSAQAGTSITVAVTPTVANVVNQIVAAFQNLYATSGYSVTVVIDSDSNIESDIISGGSTGPYDLFLSQSALLPLDLIYNHPSLVTGSQFPFAKDTLDLYSGPLNPVDISAGLPTSGIQTFAFADPTTLDPTGVAASTVLASKSAYATAIAAGLGDVVPSSASAYAVVEYLGVAYGFVPKSQICTAANGVEQYEAGTFHHEYQLGVDYYNDIVLTGIQTSRTRTTAQQTELTNFINVLTGVGTTVGTAYLQANCFNLP